MQLDLVTLSLERVADLVPKEVIAPDIRIRDRGFRGAAMSSNELHIRPRAMAVRGAAASSNELFKGIVEIAPNAGSSESGFFQLYELARQYFDSISGNAQMADTETFEEMKKQMIYINSLLTKSSFEMAKLYKCRRDNFNQEKYALLKEKSIIFGELEQDKKQCQDYLDKINALEKKSAQLTQDIAGYMAEVIEARRDLDDIHRKQDELRKWCWVPFYNIYLLVDAENALSHFNSCQQKLDIARRNHDALMREKEELHRGMMEMAGMERKTKERISKNEQAMQVCIQNINDTESKALQCSDIALYFGEINKILEFSDDAITFMDTIVPEIKKTLAQLMSQGQTLFSNSAMM